MPVYEYHCEKCDQVSEFLQKVADPPMTQCPHCGGRLHKLISLSSFQFKGSGWYATDYKHNGTGKSSAKPTTSASESTSSSESSKEPEKPKNESPKDSTSSSD